MALIICPNCGEKVSNVSGLCPCCGTAINNIKKGVTPDSIYSELDKFKIISGYNIETDLDNAETAAEMFAATGQYQGVSNEDLKIVLLSNQAKACFFGLEGSAQNYERAAAIFSYLYDHYGEPMSAYYIGKMYEEGILYEKNLQKALSFYIEAVDVNHVRRFDSAANENILALIKVGNLLIKNLAVLKGIPDQTSCGMAFLVRAVEENHTTMDNVMNFVGGGFDSFIKGLLWNYESELATATVSKNANSIFEIASLYMQFPQAMKDKYAVEWFKKGHDLGDRKCEYYYCVVLLSKDEMAYEANPDEYEVYYQNQRIKELAKKLYGAEMGTQMSNEVLVVNSKLNVEDALNKLADYIYKYHDDEASKEFGQLYMGIINSSNSYVRKKPGLPGFER